MTTLNSFIDKKEEPKLSEEDSKAKEEALQKRKAILEAQIPWQKTYAPKSLSELKGQEAAVKKIKKFLDDFERQKKKAILLWGPSGTGKSCTAYAIAEEYGYELIELNASDKRNKAIIEEQLGNILSQQSLFGSKKIVLIDDVDGISGMKDRGGASAIAKLSSTSKFPIIITAQIPYDKKLSPIRSKSTLIEFAEIKEEDIVEHISSILDKENIAFTKEHLKVIAKQSQGDLRAAIADTQMLTIGKKELDVTLLNEIEERMQNTSMKDAIKEILKSTDSSSHQAFANVQEDYDKALLWLDYNMPIEYTNKTDRARAYGCLTKSDVFLRRIRRRQQWQFLVYIQALLTVGISTAKDKAYPGNLDYKESTRILKIWQANMKLAKRKAIAEKIAIKTHSSKADVIKNFGFYKQFIPEIAEELELTEEEVAWVSQ